MPGPEMWLVVGISGVTCGGKSSLACSLRAAFPNTVLVSQDDFFLEVGDPRHIMIPDMHHCNWEIISSLDMARMEETVRCIISEETSSPRILVIEGFLIFNHEGIRKLCDYKYYLTLPKDECWARRSIRVYKPPDPPGYFDKYVWPEYERHRDEVLAKVPDIVLLDGRNSLNATKKQVILDLSTATHTHKKQS